MKHVSWKKIMNNVKLISVAVIVLMALQMLAVALVSYNRRVERFSSRAGEIFSNCIVSMDEGITYMKETALSTAASADVYRLLYSPEVSRKDILQFRNISERTHGGMFVSAKKYFIYNSTTKTLYTTGFEQLELSELPESKTKAAISGDSARGSKIVLFSDKENFLLPRTAEEGYADKEVLRLRYFPSRQNNSCLLLDIDSYELAEFFEKYQKEFSSDIFIVDAEGNLFYGSDPNLMDALQTDLQYLSRRDFETPVFRKYNGEKYLVLKRISSGNDLQAFSLIRESAIRGDYQETKTLLYTNLSVVLAVCIALALIFILKRMNVAMKESRRYQLEREQERMHNQFMRKKQRLANCLFQPSEQDIRMAKEYVDALLIDQDGNPGEIQSWSEVAVLRIEICAYESFRKAHSSRDVLLYKYGVVNICEEIFGNFLKAVSIYERDAEIVFLVIPCDDFDAKCRKVFAECQNAIEEYIGERLSAFLSGWGKMEELSELNSQTLHLSEYQFLLEEPLFLTVDFLEERSAAEAPEMTDWPEQICTACEQGRGQSVLEEMFAQVKEMQLEEAKNTLWLLMFRLYNLGKKNAGKIENIEVLVSKFNRIQRLSEMQLFFNEICVKAFLSEREKSEKKQNHTVSRVCEIIERHFYEPEFCSDSVAEEMNLSKAYLSRKYRQITGKSISETINERRLSAFADELLTTDKSVKTIINDIGGVNYNYYMIMFKKKFSMTPTEYRQEFKQQK